MEETQEDLQKVMSMTLRELVEFSYNHAKKFYEDVKKNVGSNYQSSTNEEEDIENLAKGTTLRVIKAYEEGVQLQMWLQMFKQSGTTN